MQLTPLRSLNLSKKSLQPPVLFLIQYTGMHNILQCIIFFLHMDAYYWRISTHKTTFWLERASFRKGKQCLMSDLICNIVVGEWYWW
jgi:hypothetical protein